MEEGRSAGVDGVGVGGSEGGIEMGTLEFSVAAVEVGGRESTVDVRPGIRRTTNFWMLCGFWGTHKSEGYKRK